MGKIIFLVSFRSEEEGEEDNTKYFIFNFISFTTFYDTNPNRVFRIKIYLNYFIAWKVN